MQSKLPINRYFYMFCDHPGLESEIWSPSQETEANHLIYLRWRDSSPQEVLTWHRQVQEGLLDALRTAPEGWYNDKARRPEWPFDLDGHSAYHRVKDYERLKSMSQSVVYFGARILRTQELHVSLRAVSSAG